MLATPEMGLKYPEVCYNALLNIFTQTMDRFFLLLYPVRQQKWQEGHFRYHLTTSMLGQKHVWSSNVYSQTREGQIVRLYSQYSIPFS